MSTSISLPELLLGGVHLGGDGKPKEPFGTVCYTCLPSKEKAFEYTCTKGLTKLGDTTDYQAPHKTTELISSNKRWYVLCLKHPLTREGTIQCDVGRFPDPSHEGRVHHVCVPSILPEALHESWIRTTKYSHFRIKQTDSA
jgi:hypothetical protein